MAVVKLKEVREILKLPTLNPGAKTDLKDCELVDLTRADSLALTVEVFHHADATAAVRAHVVSDTDGGSFDTVDFATFDAHLLAGKLSQKTFTVSSAPKYIKVYLENTDSLRAASDLRVSATIGYKK